MVRSCVVYKCHNKAGVWSKDNEISFCRFPKDKRKRAGWVKAIQRDKWQPTEASYVCFTHFEGEWHSDDPEDVNFRRPIFTYKEKVLTSVEKARSARANRRSLESSTWFICMQYLFNYFIIIFLRLCFMLFNFYFQLKLCITLSNFLFFKRWYDYFKNQYEGFYIFFLSSVLLLFVFDFSYVLFLFSFFSVASFIITAEQCDIISSHAHRALYWLVINHDIHGKTKTFPVIFHTCLLHVIAQMNFRANFSAKHMYH